MSSSGSAGPPLYGMPIAEAFLSDEEKTFQYDDSLPSLPVPPLHQTLSKYLDSGIKLAVAFQHTVTCYIKIVLNIGCENRV